MSYLFLGSKYWSSHCSPPVPECWRMRVSVTSEKPTALRLHESPNELRIPTNDYESITIQLRCLRMYYEFVTNYVRFFGLGTSWPKF